MMGVSTLETALSRYKPFTIDDASESIPGEL